MTRFALAAFTLLTSLSCAHAQERTLNGDVALVHEYARSVHTSGCFTADVDATLRIRACTKKVGNDVGVVLEHDIVVTDVDHGGKEYVCRFRIEHVANGSGLFTDTYSCPKEAPVPSTDESWSVFTDSLYALANWILERRRSS